MKKLEDGRITILVNSDKITIEMKDGIANTRFATAELTPEQFAQALGRLSETKCDITVRGIERIGKQMQHKRHEFVCPEGVDYKNRQEVLSKEILKTLPDGWISDNYFSSQDTFFERDGVKYAQTTIRTWK